jgi:hypothetical protein
MSAGAVLLLLVAQWITSVYVIKSHRRPVDAKFIMLSYPPPMTNLERQRKFRASHPGYSNRYKRKRDKAAIQQTILAAMAAAEKAEAEKAHAKREPLALPAPVETIEIPGMKMIAAIPTHLEVSAPVSAQATIALAPNSIAV